MLDIIYKYNNSAYKDLFLNSSCKYRDHNHSILNNDAILELQVLTYKFKQNRMNLDRYEKKIKME